jgi:hypothetical protein
MLFVRSHFVLGKHTSEIEEILLRLAAGVAELDLRRTTFVSNWDIFVVVFLCGRRWREDGENRV